MQMRPRGQGTGLPKCIPPAWKCPGSAPSLIFHAKGNPEIAAPRDPRGDNQDDEWSPPPCLSEMPRSVGDGPKYLHKPGEPASGCR